jgi:hypothetical protein
MKESQRIPSHGSGQHSWTPIMCLSGPHDNAERTGLNAFPSAGVTVAIQAKYGESFVFMTNPAISVL